MSPTWPPSMSPTWPPSKKPPKEASWVAIGETGWTDIGGNWSISSTWPPQAQWTLFFVAKCLACDMEMTFKSWDAREEWVTEHRKAPHLLFQETSLDVLRPDGSPRIDTFERVGF